jgi:hypothetical protein
VATVGERDRERKLSVETRRRPAERGRELREQGLSELRTFRVLRKEFPHVERDVLWAATGADLGSGWPLWADRSSPKPVSIRNDPRRAGDSPGRRRRPER